METESKKSEDNAKPSPAPGMPPGCLKTDRRRMNLAPTPAPGTCRTSGTMQAALKSAGTSGLGAAWKRWVNVQTSWR